MMKPKALVWLVERILRHFMQDKLSTSEIECLSRCAQDDLLFGRWSAIHLLDDDVLAFTGVFQVGGIPSRGASSGLGLRLHLAQRLDDVERLVNCFSGGDEVGFPVVFHGDKLGVGEDEWCLEVQIALGEIPLHVSLDLGTPLFDLPVSRGDVPISPFPPEITRGYRLPGATCFDPGLNPGLLFILEPLDGGRHLRPDALSFLVGLEGIITMSKVMNQRVHSRAKSGCHHFSAQKKECVAQIPREVRSVFICVPSVVAILKHQKLRQSGYADSCEPFGISLVEGMTTLYSGRKL